MLLLLATLLLAGCSSIVNPSYINAGSQHAIVQTDNPVPLQREAERGVSVALSNHSALDINVECILDYVQGEPEFSDQQQWQQPLSPWLRLHLAF